MKLRWEEKDGKSNCLEQVPSFAGVVSVTRKHLSHWRVTRVPCLISKTVWPDLVPVGRACSTLAIGTRGLSVWEVDQSGRMAQPGLSLITFHLIETRSQTVINQVANFKTLMYIYIVIYIILLKLYILNIPLFF